MSKYIPRYTFKNFLGAMAHDTTQLIINSVLLEETHVEKSNDIYYVGIDENITIDEIKKQFCNLVYCLVNPNCFYIVVCDLVNLTNPQYGNRFYGSEYILVKPHIEIVRKSK